MRVRTHDAGAAATGTEETVERRCRSANVASAAAAVAVKPAPQAQRSAGATGRPTHDPPPISKAGSPSSRGSEA